MDFKDALERKKELSSLIINRHQHDDFRTFNDKMFEKIRLASNETFIDEDRIEEKNEMER